MSRKKSKTQAIKKTESKIIDRFKWNDSYVSLLIGLFVVIIGGIIVFYFARNKTPQIQQSVPVPSPTSIQKQKVSAVKHYKVVEDDNLWIISEKFYNSGYNWVDIAKANNLENPSDIHAGDDLIIPNVKPKIPAQTVETGEVGQGSTQAITGSSYTVVKGDYLWSIAIRAYGDGFKWVDIARANNLADPDLIFSGNVLKIPRSKF